MTFQPASRSPDPAATTASIDPAIAPTDPAVSTDPIEAVVFDLGMVLVEIDFTRSFAHWGALAGVDPATLARRYAADIDYERHERGELDTRAYLASVGRRLGIELTPRQWEQGWLDLLLEPVEGIEALIDKVDPALRKAVFSNTNASHAAVFERRYGPLLRRFDRIFLSNELGMRKPEARAFERVAAELDVAPSRILFLDDNEANLAGARGVGMRTVLVRSIEDTRGGVDLANRLCLCRARGAGGGGA